MLNGINNPTKTFIMKKNNTESANTVENTVENANKVYEMEEVAELRELTDRLIKKHGDKKEVEDEIYDEIIDKLLDKQSIMSDALAELEEITDEFECEDSAEKNLDKLLDAIDECTEYYNCELDEILEVINTDIDLSLKNKKIFDYTFAIKK